MTNPRTKPTLRQRLGQLLLALSTVMIAFGATIAISMPAGAQDGCGTYSYGFVGTRLLNDGISNSAGPFSIDLPAGTYTVTLLSHDHHSTQVDIAPQKGEQYHVVLNSGYVSPASTDVPEDADVITTVFTGQVVGASTAISVTHAGAPGINSVDVLCVGFTPEAIAEPVVEKPSDEVPAQDQPTTRGPATPTEPAKEAPTSQTPVVETPTTDAPKQDIADPVDLERDRAVVPPAAVETEVEGQIELPAAPQLAVTGPATQSLILILVGLSMIALGTLLVRSEKQLA